MILCAREPGKCYYSEMWQDLGGLGGVGVNSGAHQVEFGTAGERFRGELASVARTSGLAYQSGVLLGEAHAPIAPVRACVRRANICMHVRRHTRGKQNGTPTTPWTFLAGESPDATAESMPHIVYRGQV